MWIPVKRLLKGNEVGKGSRGGLGWEMVRRGVAMRAEPQNVTSPGWKEEKVGKMGKERIRERDSRHWHVRDEPW